MLTLLHLLSAVAMLVWGTHIVRTGVMRVFGARLRTVLSRSVEKKPLAFCAGIGVTALVQSSNATTMLVTSFVAQDLVALTPALVIVLGADVGTALMARILTFDLSWLSPLLIFIGVIFFLGRKQSRVGQLGRVGIGLGLILLALELILIGYAGQAGKLAKPIFGLTLVAGFFAVIQLPFDVSMPTAIASGLKMMVMTVAFLLLFATTKLPGLTAALVKQARIPYEYAFLFTSALRFVPDFLAESQAVREAQTCRGYVPSRNPVKRLISYAALVEPMVLRAISRSETMAMSLELRGFGSAKRTFSQQIEFHGRDYLVLTLLAAMTIVVVIYR